MKKIGILMVLAVAMLSVSALADGRWGGKDVLEMGVFETGESMLKFPAAQDTNIDSLEVGNDKALAYGSIWQRTPRAIAENNLEIKKTQDSGVCQCCTATTSAMTGNDTETFGENCKDCCIKVNVDQIKVGNRNALAFGFASATNNVKIVADQQ